MRGAAAILCAALALGALPACGGGRAASPSDRVALEPRWQDALETMPELFVVVRPKAIRQDRVYGPLLRRAIQAAREQSRVVAATHPLETIEDAEEVIVGMRPDTPQQAGELLLVERGVRADIDPAALVDDDGKALWAPGPSGGIRELVRERDPSGQAPDASLFELPGRTWVVATGPARRRARDAFAHPFRRPDLDLDPSALAFVRIDGPSLVAHVPALRGSGGLSALGARLRSVTLTLPPGADGAVRVTLAYADDDATALAEVALRETVRAVARARREGLAWLGRATVAPSGRSVVVTAPLPASLLEGLLGAGSKPLGLEVPAPAPAHP